MARMKPNLAIIRKYRPNIRMLPILALRKVTSKTDRGVYASADTLFKNAIFGRDSLEVAEDLMQIRPKLAEKIILTLASLQGEKNNQENEEEPGKIVHEYRSLIVDGRPIEGTSLDIFRYLSARWGGDDHEMAYYGSIDATPLYLRVVAAYVENSSQKFLSKKVKLRSGRSITIEQSVELAISWLTTKLVESKSGLLEYHRLNMHGISNQAWKDSHEFYVHANGEAVNSNSPVASIEVQGLAYDGLLAGAKLLHRKSLIDLAYQLRDHTLEKLWWSDNEYFYLGLDYDSRGKARPIKVMTANPAELLDSYLFEQLPKKLKQKYVAAIIREIMGTEFLTDAGIRSRALSEAHLVPYWDYHGSYTTWPKETYDISKGLRRQGLPILADQLDNRLLNVIRAMGDYPEFIYVDARGRALTLRQPKHHAPRRYKNFTPRAFAIESTKHPEKIQAWTVSAFLAISSQKSRLLMRLKKNYQAIWQRELETEIMSHIPHVERLLTSRELRLVYPPYFGAPKEQL